MDHISPLIVGCKLNLLTSWGNLVDNTCTSKIENTQRLVTEIEMLKVVLCLVRRYMRMLQMHYKTS
jgi:hypothetical protein